MAPDVLAILGGSSAFTPALAAALADAATGLPPLVIRLHGRDPAHLGPVVKFCALVAAARGAPHAYEATTDLAAAVSGGRVVLNQMRIGGLAARARDERFPLAFGIPGDETIGPAGLASAIRSAEAVVLAGRATAARAPGAWFVNLTNPLGILTSLLRRVPGLRAIGLCELPAVTLRRALAWIGERPDGVDADYAGVNHQGFFIRIARNGVDLLPRIVAALAAGGVRDFPVDPAVVSRLGALPLPYFRLYAHTGRECAAMRARSQTRGDELAGLSRRLWEHYATAESPRMPDALAARDMPWIGEAVVPAIRALLGGAEAGVYASEPNDGHLAALPADAIVEKRCRLDVRGVHGARPTAPIPAPVLAFLSSVTRAEAAAAAAALAPDREHVTAALREHPLTQDRGDLAALADAVLSEAGVPEPAFRAAAPGPL